MSVGIWLSAVVMRSALAATSSRFVVHAGGNTRLQILKELNAVSDDPTFSIVNCIFVEWNSESSVLLAHLRENDLRGDLTFVDKAVAICALDELLGHEDNRNGSSIRQLRDVLKEKGYGISVALISWGLPFKKAGTGQKTPHPV